MNRFSFVCEAVEPRRLYSAAAATTGVNVIGPSAGLYAASSTPVFASLSTKSTANPSDPNAAADLDTAIKFTITPADGHGGIDATSLVRAAVRLTDLTTGKVYRSSDTSTQPSELQRVKTSGGGDVLVVQTNDPLPANHNFRIEINGTYVTNNLKVRDVQGTAFAPYTGTFTTGTFLPTADSSINFEQFKQNVTSRAYVATTIGPDRKLYASTTDGFIYRYNIARDGTLSGEQEISTIRTNNGGARIITGITFDPGSFAAGAPLVLWVSHNQYRFGNAPNGSDDVQKYADNFTGKISVISGENLQNYQDRIINIPRSVKDHMNNQLVFSSNGKILYFGVAGLNAMGAADGTWGNRVENIYSASIMQLRLGSGPTGYNTYFRARGLVDLKLDGDQNTATGIDPSTWHYNIFKGTNPLRLYATGVRNAFDLVVASNGKLYANINGSSAGGNVPATPAFSSVPVAYRIDKDKKDRNGNFLYKNADGTYKTYAGPASQGLTNVRQVEQDTLLAVNEGSYYGHPNPARGEYVFNGANPTTGSDNDPFEISSYPNGQAPDRNYELPVYDYGTNFSPDGIIQYKAVGNVNKKLDGYLLSVRYSGGSDILALKPNSDGSIDTTATQERINGFTKLGSPLDLVQDLTNGNLYVTSLTDETGVGTITLLKPTSSSGTANASVSPSKLGFYVKPGGSTITRQVTITNTGTADLTFDPKATRVGGSGRKNFLFGSDFPANAVVLPAGTSLTLNIGAYLAKGQTTTAAASLQLATDDPDSPFVSINLRAFNANTTA